MRLRLAVTVFCCFSVLTANAAVKSAPPPVAAALERMCNLAEELAGTAWQARLAGMTREDIMNWYVSATRTGTMTTEQATRAAYYATLPYRESFTAEEEVRHRARALCGQQSSF